MNVTFSCSTCWKAIKFCVVLFSAIQTTCQNCLWISHLSIGFIGICNYTIISLLSKNSFFFCFLFYFNLFSLPYWTSWIFRTILNKNTGIRFLVFLLLMIIGAVFLLFYFIILLVCIMFDSFFYKYIFKVHILFKLRVLALTLAPFCQELGSGCGDDNIIGSLPLTSRICYYTL